MIITGIKVKSSNKLYYDNIFKADKIILNINLKSILFSNLVIVNNLIIENPKFFLEIIQKSSKTEGSLAIYDDNIGLAKKLTENSPDKIWPQKKEILTF